MYKEVTSSNANKGTEVIISEGDFIRRRIIKKRIHLL